MHTRSIVWALVVAAACAAGCTAIVNGKLNKKPDRRDGSVGGPCMGPADCNDGDACNGVEGCEMGACTAGTRAADGASCDDGNPATHNICLMAACVVGRCGDGTVDPTATPAEECDDRNTVEGDGCDNDCSFSCSLDTDCNDMDPCNGIERCGIDTNPHICRGGLAPPDGTMCGGGRTCRAGMCT